MSLKANRLRTIQDENNNVQAQYEYFGNDNIKSVTLGNGVRSDYTYDGDGNVASLVTVTSTGEVLVDYNYAYDLNGNRLQKVSNKHKNYYSYDSMNRLVDSSYDGRKESFTYDKVGNRLTKTTNDITEKYVYDVKNQLKEIYQEKGNSTHIRSLSKFDLAKCKIWSLTYDKQGNTISEETTTGNNLFEYNTLNQQVKAITKDGNTLVNRYDAEGLRYEIEENEALSKFIFNRNGDTLVELNKDNEVVSRFTRGYEIVAADVKDDRYYYSVDEQGSTEFITDVSQKVRNEYRYDAFGNVLEAKEDIHNRITYTGQQFDEITQQYYLRARFYNPVNYYDPSGYGRAIAIDSSKVNDQKVMDIIYKHTNGTNILPTNQADVEKFFNTISEEEFKIIFSNRVVKNQMKNRFRAGEVHEWFKVSHLDIYKSWGMNGNEIFAAVTPTKNAKFFGIATKNGIESGIHGTNSASSMAHREMDKMILNSSDKQSYVDKLIKWSEKHYAFVDENEKVIKKGSEALPEYFHDCNSNKKQEKPKKCRG